MFSDFLLDKIGDDTSKYDLISFYPSVKCLGLRLLEADSMVFSCYDSVFIKFKTFDCAKSGSFVFPLLLSSIFICLSISCFFISLLSSNYLFF